MARSRLLKPGFFANEDLARLSMAHRLLFAGLWTLADREGRLLDRPPRIRVALFPYDAEVTTSSLDAMLDDLSRADFIVRYSYPHLPRTDVVLSKDRLSTDHRDERAIAIRTFHLHQHPHRNESPSAIEPPTDEIWRKFNDSSKRSDVLLTKDRPTSLQGPSSYGPKDSTTPAVYGVRSRCTESESESESDPKDKSTAAKNASAVPPKITQPENGDDDDPDATRAAMQAQLAVAADNLRIITKLVHDTLAADPGLDDGDLREAVKRTCARGHLAYDASTVNKAVDIARVQRRRQAHA